MKRIFLTACTITTLVSCGSPEGGEDVVDGVTNSEHRIFLSSNSYAGNMGDGGGLTSADNYCNSLAEAAGLERTYKAILSSSSLNANDSNRINLSGAIYIFNASGEKTLVAASSVDFWATETKDLIQSVSFDEKLASVSGATVWTGSGYEGAVNTDHCNSWTSNSSGDRGFYGTSDSVDDQWIENNTDPCNVSKRIYCISM